MDNIIMSEEYTDLIIDSDSIDSKEIPDNVIYFNVRHSFMYVPIENIDRCSIGEEYRYHNIPNCYTLQSLMSLEKSGVTSIQNNPFLALRGQGVLIGVIDTGIDYQHEAFLYDNKTTKIVSLWDQTIQNDNNTYNNIAFGTEYNQEMINLALLSENPLEIVPSRDEIGHGTSIAGIIAGNESISNNFTGVVPNAEFVVVKLKQAKNIIRDIFSIPRDAICYQENDIMLGVNYAYNVAQKLGRPITICIALGSSQGSHDGRGALSAYLSAQNDSPGTAIVTAAGNEGSTKRHYYGTIDRQTKYNNFELKVGANEMGFSMEIWQRPPYLLSIELISPSGETISPTLPRLSECRRISFVFEKTIVYINNIISEAETGDQLILVRFESPTEGIWQFNVANIDEFESIFNVWLPSGNLISENTYFLNPNPDTTLTSPANAFYPLTITAYNHENDSIWLNSSRGYTRINTIKPDLAAPGVGLLSPMRNNQYGTTSGTGAAAAHACGITAMLLEWGVVRGNYPSMHGTGIRQILVRGAKRDSDIIYPNNIWGYGIIDVFGAFNSLR